MDRKNAVSILMAYAACMISENCRFCPQEGNCSGWTEEEVREALRCLNEVQKDDEGSS